MGGYCQFMGALLMLHYIGDNPARSFSVIHRIQSAPPSMMIVPTDPSFFRRAPPRSFLHLATSPNQAEEEEDEDIEFLFQGHDDDDDDDDTEQNDPETQKKEPVVVVDNLERAWRYAKRPLLSIGAKGATLTHGNSLRQLLQDHTIVKVKVQTKKFDGSLEKAFEVIKDLAVETGAPKDLELVQSRASESVILFGMPGTLERIEAGTFPPPTPKTTTPATTSTE